MTTPIEEDYLRRAVTPSDINEHLGTLRQLARETCGDVAEFGVRTGNSTIALLAGIEDRKEGGTLHSYDLNPAQVTPPERARSKWNFTQADTSKLNAIPFVSLLFIDTLHTYEQVKAELRHAARVDRYLAFHDTVLFGWREEHTGAPIGINRAIFEFLLSPEGRHWSVCHHNPANNGLTVLERF